MLLTTTEDGDLPMVPRLLMWGPSSLSFSQKISVHCFSNTFYFPFSKCYTKELSTIHSLLPDVAPNVAYG